MRAIMAAGFGLTFALSAFTLAAGPTSAFETPVVSKAKQSFITKVDERDHERCERVRRECRERHHEHEKEYRECVVREHCD